MDDPNFTMEPMIPMESGMAHTRASRSKAWEAMLRPKPSKINERKATVILALFEKYCRVIPPALAIGPVYDGDVNVQL